ncbi:hypothetical protein [Streptomyces sp. NPDC014894]|uniref:hypothetical protein n=1 Tax=unclassified Streptomyces TaxID=2593676 RepID=UPI00370149B5
MIKINSSFSNPIRVADRSIVASACSLGFSASFNGTGVSGFPAEMSLLPLGGLPVRTGNERPTEALEAGAAAAEARTYAFAAASAGHLKQTQQQHHSKWAFRGLEPWSDPA